MPYIPATNRTWYLGVASLQGLSACNPILSVDLPRAAHSRLHPPSTAAAGWQKLENPLSAANLAQLTEAEMERMWRKYDADGNGVLPGDTPSYS